MSVRARGRPRLSAVRSISRSERLIAAASVRGLTSKYIAASTRVNSFFRNCRREREPKHDATARPSSRTLRACTLESEERVMPLFKMQKCLMRFEEW